MDLEVTSNLFQNYLSTSLFCAYVHKISIVSSDTQWLIKITFSDPDNQVIKSQVIYKHVTPVCQNLMHLKSVL